MEPFPSAGNYCDTSPNSVVGGDGAVMHWSGSFSVAAASFTVEVDGAPPNLSGQFFFGPIQIKAPFGDGVQCVGGTVNRLPVVTTDANGHAWLALDFGNAPANQIVGGVHLELPVPVPGGGIQLLRCHLGDFWPVIPAVWDTPVENEP